MHAAEHAHFAAAYATRHFFQLNTFSYYNLVFSRHWAPTTSCPDTPSSLVRARKSPTRFTGPSNINSSITTSSANTTVSPPRYRNAVANLSTTTSRVSSETSLQTLHPHPVSGSVYGVLTAYLRRAPTTDRIVWKATRQRGLKPRYCGEWSHLSLCLVALPLTMLLEFLLEFLLRICFVRTEFLSFAFRFDCVVQLLSKCPFVALIFWFIARLTSMYIWVFVSVCYSGPPATGFSHSIFITRPTICDGSVFLFLSVHPAPFA